MLRLLILPFTPRFIALTVSVAGFLASAAAARGDWSSPFFLATLVFGALCALGLHDLYQREHAILRAYPISAHLRFLLEDIRPELRQYFFEDNKDGRPFSRDTRAIVYQRAKMNIDKRPFGTEIDVYEEGFEWLRHSIAARPVSHEQFRTRVGAARCALPYDISLLNVSAMSFGALSGNAIRALNLGARKGEFAQDTGEGGFSPYHRESGGDIVWQIASGYFGCRTRAGDFDPQTFATVAASDQIKMIEVKLSQGAKPGHGGVLPASKVSAEIAQIRGVPMGEDCVSPSAHSAFSTPIELLRFLARLRELSGGKPVGFKFCVGQPWEFLAICKAMLETGIYPDFIVVDGKEGGTGSAPLEFMDHIGMPMRDGLSFVHHALIGVGLRETFASAPPARSPPDSTWRALSRSARIGAIADAASCSRSAAFNPCPAIRIAARPGSRRKTPRAPARWWSPTRRSACAISTARRSSPSPSWRPRRASTIRANSRPSIFVAAFPRMKRRASPSSIRRRRRALFSPARSTRASPTHGAARAPIRFVRRSARRPDATARRAGSTRLARAREFIEDRRRRASIGSRAHFRERRYCEPFP